MNTTAILKIIRDLADAAGYDLVERKPQVIKKKVMPTGIKRPGPKTNYDALGLEEKAKRLAIGDSYVIKVTAPYKVARLQSAMLNAAERVLGEKRMATSSKEIINRATFLRLTRLK